jgi:DegV family protein with EDD domain
MAAKIALVADSTCDIPVEWRKKYDLTVIPMTLIFGDQQYLDGVDMTANQFYERLSTETQHPTTSQPSPAVFQDAFEKLGQAGAEEIVAILISSAMSGTYASAAQAAQNFEVPVHVVDSRSNSMALGWQVIAAARAREAGADAAGMVKAADEARATMTYYVALDTIEYLSRGGRIGTAVKFLDSMLNIKPLIYVNHETGTVAPALPARSRKSVLKALYKNFFKQMEVDRQMHLTVLHNNAESEALEILEKIEAEYQPVEMNMTIVSPVLGAHTGPRAVAICGYYD